MLPYVLANILIVPLATVVQHLLVCKVTSIRHPKFYVLLGPGTGLLLWSINNYILPQPNVVIDTAILLGMPLLALLFAEKGCRVKALLTMTVYMGVQIAVYYLLGLFAFPIAEAMGYSAADLINNTTSYGSAVMALILLILTCPVLYLSAIVLEKLFAQPRISAQVLLFLPIPISQAIMVNLLNHMIPLYGGLHNMMLGFILAIIFSVAADVCFFVGAAKVHRGELLKQQVALAKDQMEIQAGYYRQLQDQILRINQIRHDLGNQLQAAYHLLELGEKSQVRRQLDQLQDDIQNQVGTQFCANLMVDAILAEKARLCREKGIRLDIQAELPADIPIEGIHLCSAFSNLLDNSIHGVGACSAGEKSIELRTAVKNGCLIIRCINPANAPSKKQSADPLRLHSLGLGILERIASVYGGTLNISYHDGKFDAALTLCFPK